MKPPAMKKTPQHPTMKTPSPTHLKTSLAALLTSLALASVANAATKTWTNTSTDDPPTQKWSTGANWSGNAAPVAGDTVNVYRSGSAAASVLLDYQTPQFTGIVDVDFGSTLLIASGGNLRFGTGGVLRIGGGTQNDASTSFVTVEAGGQINSSAAANTGANSALYVFNKSTLTTSGTINVANITVQRQSLIKLEGGSITTTNDNYGLLLTNSSMSQTGGTLNTARLSIDPTSTYTISGGVIADNHTGASPKGLYFTNTPNSTSGGTLAVIGSAATISFASYTNDVDTSKTNGTTKRPTFSFTLDNSAQHISTINIGDSAQASGNNTQVLRQNANLALALQGGILLSDTNTYTLIQRGTSNTDSSGWFNQGTIFGSGSLWKDATSSLTTIQIVLNSAQNQGAFDASGGTPLTFAAANVGYVTLSNVDTGSPLTLGLNVSGGTLSNFTSALSTAGIGWTASAPGYDLAITLDPSTAGSGYFAWDLSSIDSAMGLTGIGLIAIPEPATVALAFGIAGLLVVALRRRRA